MKYSIYSLLIIAAVFSGCSKDDDDNSSNNNSNNNTGNTGITVSSPWQYSIKVGSTTYTAQEGVSDFQGNFSWQASLTTLPDSSSTGFGSGLSDNNSINKSFGVDLGFVHFAGNQCDTNKFKAVIHTGNYLFHGTGSNPVEISFVDANGEIWGTDNGSGDQTGSNFTVTDVARVGVVQGNLQLKIKATFNCILYNFSTGASVTLTDGVYVGKVENYN
jgi:hypothetical protein